MQTFFYYINMSLLLQTKFIIFSAGGGVSLNIGKYVKEFRLKKGWTLAKLSSESGVSKPYLSQIENTPNKQISAEKLYQLAIALEVTMGQLMGKEVALNRQEDVPAILLAFAEKNGLHDEQIQMLANIKYRGKQPSTEDEWEKIFLAIKTSIESE
ncbi:XRE family transcriptional regulator [Peribacillus frigoritolerans]|nr:XRE family transcriptional regulator [Peribacillus frigoritolerans]